MFARRLATILPPLAFPEALEAHSHWPSFQVLLLSGLSALLDPLTTHSGTAHLNTPSVT
jgi:hypothetical protein